MTWRRPTASAVEPRTGVESWPSAGLNGTDQNPCRASDSGSTLAGQTIGRLWVAHLVPAAKRQHLGTKCDFLFLALDLRDQRPADCAPLGGAPAQPGKKFFRKTEHLFGQGLPWQACTCQGSTCQKSAGPCRPAPGRTSPRIRSRSRTVEAIVRWARLTSSRKFSASSTSSKMRETAAAPARQSSHPVASSMRGRTIMTTAVLLDVEDGTVTRQTFPVVSHRIVVPNNQRTLVAMSRPRRSRATAPSVISIPSRSVPQLARTYCRAWATLSRPIAWISSRPENRDSSTLCALFMASCCRGWRPSNSVASPSRPNWSRTHFRIAFIFFLLFWCDLLARFPVYRSFQLFLNTVTNL